MYIMLLGPVYFSYCNLAKSSLFEIGLKFKQWVTVHLACNADGNEKLPPLVTGKYRSSHRFNNVKKLSIKYEANTNSWMTTKIFEDYLIKLC
jgi:hypothetical protein